MLEEKLNTKEQSVRLFELGIIQNYSPYMVICDEDKHAFEKHITGAKVLDRIHDMYSSGILTEILVRMGEGSNDVMFLFDYSYCYYRRDSKQWHITFRDHLDSLSNIRHKYTEWRISVKSTSIIESQAAVLADVLIFLLSRKIVSVEAVNKIIKEMSHENDK